MHIIIKKARKKTFWYAEHIGEIFGVISSNKGNYKVEKPYGFLYRGSLYVEKTDCEEIKNVKHVKCPKLKL